jgi:hypothetical protein
LDPNKFPLDKLPCFSFAKNTPFFTLIISTSVLVTTQDFSNFGGKFLFLFCLC